MQLGARLQGLTAQTHIDGPAVAASTTPSLSLGNRWACVKTPAFDGFFKATNNRETQRRQPRRQPVDQPPGLLRRGLSAGFAPCDSALVAVCECQ